MATFTSLGIGSGLDLNTMVTQLVALERRPLFQMQTEAGRLQTQVSALGTINSLFSALQDASNKLTGTSLWQQVTVASSDAGVVSAGAGSTAATGTYAVTVQALATNQTLASGAALGAATELVGSGTLTLQLGAWDATQSSFTVKTGSSATTLEIGASDTLESLREKINAADAGVTASLVTDASGVRLALRSNATGAENGFRLTVADADNNDTDTAGLSRFAFDPPGGATVMALKQAAGNARATVNGIAVESASNELGTVVAGVTLTLHKESAAAVSIGVSRDRTAVVSAIKTFAEAYNALASYISSQTKYDAASKQGGALQGDSTVTGLQSRLRAVLGTSSGASSTFARLSDVGLQAQRDGTLSVDSAKLDSATNNLVELKKAFANGDGLSAANDGFARRYATLAGQALGVDGTVTTRSNGLQKLVTKNSDDQARLNDRVERFQQRLVAQYTQMDATLSKLNALNSYVTQQVAQWTKASSN